MFGRYCRFGVGFSVVLFSTSGASAQSGTLEFNRDIRPILSENCFLCHGPDKQRSGLRLDQPEVALEKLAIVPGKPGESELVRRINSDDPEERMPLAESNRTLTQAQIDTLTRWIAEGANYEPHWAFQPVRHADPPRVDDARGWMRSPIDAFVLARLEPEGLRPRDAADKARLLRRATFDLTGLPPTVDEVESFLADDAPDAYARAVDRLLASPRYGEHMAVGWLDLARFADTYGYQNDRPSRMWPWRDWVIRAFNDNLPYDDFVTWQIAGDLLPIPTQDQVLATGFNRLHRQTNEGGSINEEFLVEYAVDRTDTFGAAFLGLTMQCARCHDHKFDPISQREYYSLFAFFSNIDESGMYSHFTDATPTPNMFLYEPGQAEEHAALKSAIAKAEDELEKARGASLARFLEWRKIADTEPTVPAPRVHLKFESADDGNTPNEAKPDAPATIAADIEMVEGRSGQGIHLSGENSVTIKDGAFERTDPFSIAAWLRLGDDGKDKMVVWHKSMAASDAGSRGYELYLEDGHLVASLVHFWPGNAIRVRTTETVPKGEWVHVATTYDGSSRAAGLRIYINGALAKVEYVRDNLYGTITYGGDGPPLTIGARFRDPGFKDGYVDEFKLFDFRLTDPEVAAVAEDRSPMLDNSTELEYYVERADAEYRAARDRLHAARKAESDFAETLRQVMIMREMDWTPSAHVLARGAYDRPADEVAPDTPAAVLPLDPNLPRNRLGLAMWLVSEDNPLTSRVAVNRFWMHFFGRGLVDTVEDFGSQGHMPSHPELLDYLASTFMESGWDVKQLCRSIVTSATYMQDSMPDPALLDRDPDNALLARGPRNRLTAEETRDAALAASGLLTGDIGGESVKPYQPEGLWEEAASVKFEADTGDKLYRRSMYTYIKRTVPPPMMLTFDATNREMCIARREVTETPLQALVLMNDPQFVEASRVLAERALEAHAGDSAAAIDEAFVRLTGRRLHANESGLLQRAFAEQRAFFTDDNAKAYTSTGTFAADDTMDPADLAAMTAVVQLLMNYDEFQVKS